MRKFLVFFVALAAGIAADDQFNGRWDISVPHEAKSRVWWLEISGAGTPNVKGKFVGFPGGDTNNIQTISIKNGELSFSFGRGDTHQQYTARLSGGKLAGTMRSGEQELKWTGFRAPIINEKDDGSWHEGKPVELFNHKSLAGWHGLVGGQELGWSVKDGLLASTGHANNLVSDAKFWNFKLHVEYNVGARSNSGIGLRGRYEVQILDDYGRPPQSHGNGALYSRIAPSVNASKPAGEWQTFDIRLVGRQVTVVLNDKKIIDKQEIEGLTAIASDSEEGKPGPIVLQGDHGPVEFRNIVITPLSQGPS